MPWGATPGALCLHFPHSDSLSMRLTSTSCLTASVFDLSTTAPAVPLTRWLAAGTSRIATSSSTGRIRGAPGGGGGSTREARPPTARQHLPAPHSARPIACARLRRR